MPELKPLPCPHCGGMNAVPMLNEDGEYFVMCCACGMSGPTTKYMLTAIAAWNSLPRRPDYNDTDCAGCPERRRSFLRWTTEPPKVEHVGKWFWSKIPGQSTVPVIVAELDGVLGIGRGTSEEGLTMETCREFGVKFAGPIPTPE